MYNKLIASTSSYPEEYQDIIIIIEPIIFTIAQRWFKIKNVQQAHIINQFIHGRIKTYYY
jgi:hypothetical protein